MDTHGPKPCTHLSCQGSQWPRPLLKCLIAFFRPHCRACGISVSQPGTEPLPTVVKVWSPNHWTAREFPLKIFFYVFFFQQ